MIYVASHALQQKLEELSVREDLGKVVQHLLVGPAKRMRVAGDIVQFWRFNRQAIAALLERQGIEWKPEVRDSFADSFGEELRRGLEEGDEYDLGY